LGVACLGLAKALSRKGAHVTFVLPKKVDVDYDFMDVVFAEVEDESELMKGSYTNPSWWFKTGECIDFMPCDYLKASFKYAEKVRKLAKKLSADVVHVHDWMTYMAGIAASEVLGKPLVTHIHNTVFDRGGGNYNPYEYKLEKLGFEKADKIISVSNYTKNMLIDKYGIKKDKIEVVHNGVEETVREDLPLALKPLKDLGYKVVLYLGRITLQKGVDYLIYAAKKVLEKNPKVIFVIVGSGDMQEQMMSLAASLGILDKVIFTGFLRGEDRTRIFQAADLCVMPSVSEPFGIVPLEAVAFGTPVLVSKQSGVSEVLKHALKVDFWDVDEMTNKILSVCQYPELGLDLSKESAKELPSVNWDNAADKCMGVYNQLVH